jgi:hypothetical protein
MVKEKLVLEKVVKLFVKSVGGKEHVKMEEEMSKRKKPRKSEWIECTIEEFFDAEEGNGKKEVLPGSIKYYKKKSTKSNRRRVERS